MENGGNELHLLRHALGESLGRSGLPLRQVEAGEPFVEPLLRRGAVRVLEAGKVQKHLVDLHLAIEPALFGEVADAILVRFPDMASIEKDGAGIRGRGYS